MTGSTPLRAVFFDIDDTLFSTTEFAQKARRNAIQSMIDIGLRVNVDEALQELNEIIREFTSNHAHHFDKLLQRIPATTYEGINPVLIVAAGVIGYHQTKYDELHAFPDAVHALQALNNTPLLLGVITAGLAIKQAEKLIRLDLYRYIDPRSIFISDQIGISKPNPKLFLQACHRSGIRPEETIYVGNDPINDIDPAHDIGMVTVLIQRAGTSIRSVGNSAPRYRIAAFDELLAILKDDFAVNVAS